MPRNDLTKPLSPGRVPLPADEYDYDSSDTDADETDSSDEAQAGSFEEETAHPLRSIYWQQRYNICVAEVAARAAQPIPPPEVARLKKATHAELFRAQERVRRGTFCVWCRGWVDTYAKWRRHNSHSTPKDE